MRLIAFVAATFIASGPVAAQDWREYAYSDYAFTVVFPANPWVETTTYQLADGRMVFRPEKWSGARSHVFFPAGLNPLEGGGMICRPAPSSTHYRNNKIALTNSANQFA